jgi:hypothetical protein
MPPAGPPSTPVRPVRYQPLGKGESSAGASRVLIDLAAPVAGSRLLFPRRLARSVEAVRRNEPLPAIPNAHARWFFAETLVFPVDPATLTERLQDRVRGADSAMQLSEQFLDEGDWTDVVAPVAETVEHRETVELVEYGQRYRAMPSFKRMRARARRNKPVRRYGTSLDSDEKIHAYFRYFLDLIDSIREHGMRDQGSLAGMQVPIGLDVRGRHARHRNNIGVAVAADGRLLRFLGGRHRMAIAQALGLNSVPVEVRFVHARWLAAEAERSGLPPDEALQVWARRARQR